MTGATSMLGIALINECIKNGVEVLAVIRPHSINANRIPKSGLITTVECGLDKINQLKNYTNRTYDIFYHFGWESTEKESRNNTFLQTVNINYTLEAVKAAKELGCEAFVGAGSQAEYGRVNSIISPNTFANPETPYGIAKYAAGKLSAVLCKELGIRHVWTRIFSIYGMYDNPNTMIMYCIRKLLNGERPILTKCEQMWDYLYCEDAARAFTFIGEKGRDEAVYCIGSGKANSLYDYVLMIKNAIDKDLTLGIGELEYAPIQVMHLCADIKQLTVETGFVPKVDFEQGIIKTINWYRENKLENI